jgi:iron complex outermembrane receptor protein
VILRNAGRLSSLIALTLVVGALHAQEKPDLASMSVDDLMNVEVTSVSRKAQKLSDTAAAVFVISQDDIRRSGATSIPEVLRMVPGLDVAKIDGNVWAVSARGFNGKFANMLLVMIDGRSIYTPFNSGVYWSLADTMLEDIDRIEVIRGRVIEFRIVGNRVRFDINRTSAIAAQLSISSKLLSVARAIQEGSAPQ